MIIPQPMSLVQQPEPFDDWDWIYEIMHDGLRVAISFGESGSKVVADVPLESEEKSEVVEQFGGPCRGRTYGPLIKSQLLYQLS